jgi:DNA (cytosine-5)-methyltransferase 1
MQTSKPPSYESRLVANKVGSERASRSKSEGKVTETWMESLYCVGMSDSRTPWPRIGATPPIAGVLMTSVSSATGTDRKTGTTVGVVDFFSGCGGTSYGFASARSSRVRFQIRGALDIDRHANATYERMLGVRPHALDIREAARPRTLRRLVGAWGLATNQPLVVIGCSPCQGFSSHRKKDPRSDARNSLLRPFAEIVVQLGPSVVVMENVPEMLREEHWPHFARWKERLEAEGYTVRAQIHNLASFGVPQERYRVLVVASRDWPRFRMPQPRLQPEEFVTVREAIGGLRPLASGGCDPLDPMHQTSRHRPETIARLKLIPHDGGSRRALPRSSTPACLRRVDGFRDVYGRLAWDLPAVAITARCRTPSCGRFAHPEQDRGLTVREAALLQGFPADYWFEGPFDDRFKQIGNAVSPVFARVVAEHLAKEWFAGRRRPATDRDLHSDIRGPFRKSFSSSIASLKRRLRAGEASAGVAIV